MQSRLSRVIACVICGILGGILVRVSSPPNIPHEPASAGVGLLYEHHSYRALHEPTTEIRRRYLHLADMEETNPNICSERAPELARKNKECMQEPKNWCFSEDYLALRAVSVAEPHGASPTLFCGVYVNVKTHQQARVAAQTWMPFCDASVLASDVEDSSIPTVLVPQERGKFDEYGNMWRKTVALVRYMKAQAAIYDFYLLCGPDTYVILGNLKLFLRQPWIQRLHATRKPLYIGRRFKDGEILFNTGGSGYLLNSHALQELAGAYDNDSRCEIWARTSKEDVMNAHCLRLQNINPVETRDAAGRDRFHPFRPGHHFFLKPFHMYGSPTKGKSDWYSTFHCRAVHSLVRWGLDAISPTSISFHYLRGEDMQRTHTLLHRCWRGGQRGMTGQHSYPDGCKDMACAATTCQQNRSRCMAWKLLNPATTTTIEHDVRGQIGLDLYTTSETIDVNFTCSNSQAGPGESSSRQPQQEDLPYGWPKRATGPVLTHPAVKQIPRLATTCSPSDQKANLDDIMFNLFELGRVSPAELLIKLREDPLGVRNITSKPLICPSRRIASPDMRNMTAEAQFRAGKGVVYFQHLRKAGGTSFCKLARDNMGQDRAPPYFCMIDNAGRMLTPPYHGHRLLAQKLNNSRWRIVANEWDAFPPPETMEALRTTVNLVTATALRDPVVRWFSQYRFEHLEHRDGTTRSQKVKSFRDWYTGWIAVVGTNYYTKTFLGANLAGLKRFRRADSFHWTYEDLYQLEICWNEMKAAMNTLLRMDLILITEWMKHAWHTEMIRATFGWEKPASVVLPHHRGKHTQRPQLTAEEEMVFHLIRRENWQDVLLFEWAQRLVFERAACANLTLPLVEWR